MVLDEKMRVAIVAEDPLARAGLAALLAHPPECEVVEQASGEDDLYELLQMVRADVVVWDLGWDPTQALERLAEAQDLGLPVVALLPDATSAREAWNAGARGLLPRTVDSATLIEALRAAAQGLVVLDPAMAPTLPLTRDRHVEPAVEELTPREIEVLRLLAEGLPNKGIAHLLGISEHTVKFHVNAIMARLNAQSRTEAVTRATRLGLIPL